MIERTTRCPEAVPLFSISIEVCVRAFISTLISMFGVLATLTSDRGHNSCHPSGPKYAVSSELQPLRLQVFILFSCKFLSKMEKAITCFSIPWPHHVQPSRSSKLPLWWIHSLCLFVKMLANLPLLLHTIVLTLMLNSGASFSAYRLEPGVTPYPVIFVLQ